MKTIKDTARDMFPISCSNNTMHCLSFNAINSIALLLVHKYIVVHLKYTIQRFTEELFQKKVYLILLMTQCMVHCVQFLYKKFIFNPFATQGVEILPDCAFQAVLALTYTQHMYVPCTTQIKIKIFFYNYIIHNITKLLFLKDFINLKYYKI